MHVRCLRQDQFLTDEKLHAMSTEKLFHHFKMARAAVSFIFTYYGSRCCEICNEYIGDDWEKDVAEPAKPFSKYLKRVKVILDSRPDQYSHRNPKSKNITPKCVKRSFAKVSK